MLPLFFLAAFFLQDNASDLDSMQGEWKILEGSRRGDPWPKEELAKMKFIVKKNNFILDDGVHRPTPAILLLNEEKTPREFRLKVRGGRKGEFLLGIYQLKKDHLKICWSEPGEERPGDHEPKAKRFSLFMTRK